MSFPSLCAYLLATSAPTSAEPPGQPQFHKHLGDIDLRTEQSVGLRAPSAVQHVDHQQLVKALKRNTRDKARPTTPWPRVFELELTSERGGLTVTEHLFFDLPAHKMRAATSVALLGLAKTQVGDLYFDGRTHQLAVQAGGDCVCKHSDWDMAGVAFFFSMFHGLTEYRGKKGQRHLLRMTSMGQLQEGVLGGLQFWYSEQKPWVLEQIVVDTEKTGKIKMNVTKQPNLKEEIDEEEFEFPFNCREMDKDTVEDSDHSFSFLIYLITKFGGLENELMKIVEHNLEPSPREEVSIPEEVPVYQDESAKQEL